MKTQKQPTHATPTDQRPTCCECGGHNVETNAWIETLPDGTHEVVNTEGPITDEYGNWCHDCDTNVDLEYPELTEADHARRQAATYARANGPELVAVLQQCRDALQTFRDYHRGAGPWNETDEAAIEAADEMLSRCAPAIRRKN